MQSLSAARLLRVAAFGLWCGVMIGFAFIFAPIAFNALGPVPVFAGIVARVINGITLFGYGCAAVVVIASLFDLRAPVRAAAITVVALVMAGLGWYETHVIVPLMQHTALQTPAYDALHRRSSGVYSAILLLGLFALVWSSQAERR